MIYIEIKTEGAAFTEDLQGEVSRILKDFLIKYELGDVWDKETPLLDINGNVVGYFKQC
jgi:hypothetical protein